MSVPVISARPIEPKKKRSREKRDNNNIKENKREENPRLITSDHTRHEEWNKEMKRD
jgi:hypothetical protein